MKYVAVGSVLVALIVGAFTLRTVLPSDASPDLQEAKKFGDMPVQVAEDGSIVPDPNALGIGPEGVTERDPSPQAELAQTLASIPADRKLVLAEGRVVGVAGVCSYPENYDPSKKCIGLHDVSNLTVITIDLQGQVIGRSDRSGTGAAVTEGLLADDAVKDQIVDFLKNAPTD